MRDYQSPKSMTTPSATSIFTRSFLDNKERLNLLTPDEKKKLESEFLVKGSPCFKLASECEKLRKSLLVAKSISDFFTEQESKEQSESVQYEISKSFRAIIHTELYQLVPSFFKFVIGLRKQKREFAFIFHISDKYYENFKMEMNLFMQGIHPLFCGFAGTSLFKMNFGKNPKIYSIDDKALICISEVDQKSPQILGVSSRSSGNEKSHSNDCDSFAKIYTKMDVSLCEVILKERLLRI